MDNEMDDKYNVNIGSYNLLQSSIDAMPYLGKKSIVFVDSSANEMVFVIKKMVKLLENIHFNMGTTFIII